MAGLVRTTTGGIGGLKYSSQTPGTPTGVGLNTFGLQAIRGVITGSQLAPILMNAIEIARETAVADWPRITGASGDTIRTEVVEEGSHYARVALLVGGEQLINDPRNKSHKDYAPFVEFNGTSKTCPGTISNALWYHTTEIKERIREGVRELIIGAVGG